jgi:hypothetical protein
MAQTRRNAWRVLSLHWPRFTRQPREGPHKWDEQVAREGETVFHEKPAQHLIAEVPHKQAKVEITIGVDLGGILSHYCTLTKSERGSWRGPPQDTSKAIEK